MAAVRRFRSTGTDIQVVDNNQQQGFALENDLSVVG
jgi:hypothetical protein